MLPRRGKRSDEAPPRAAKAKRRPVEAIDSDPGDLALFERLDQVALLEVLEVGEADAALEALADFTSIFLEPLER